MWASIFGVIISIVAFWLRRKPETLQPIQNIVGDFKEKNLNHLTKFQHNPAFAEFSSEIKPNIERDNTQN